MLLLFTALMSWAAAAENTTNSSKIMAYAGKPYDGSPLPLPGIIPAVRYDVAPGNTNGVAYNRVGTPHPSSARTTGDSIGLGTVLADHVSIKGEKEKEGGFYVGWTEVGDWWNYTVQVREAGTYVFGGKFAAGEKGAQLVVSFTPAESPGTSIIAAPIEIPTTAGYQPTVEVYHVWETLPNLAEISLKSGTYVMRVELKNKSGLNIENYSLELK